jgi:hypothetical protein
MMLHAATARAGGRLALQSDPIRLNFVPKLAGLDAATVRVAQAHDSLDLEASNQLLDTRSRQLLRGRW